MFSLAVQETLGQLPITKINESLHQFIEPIVEKIPDKRFKRSVSQSILGILGSCSPVVSAMAQSLSRTSGASGEGGSVWALAKRFYRFLSSRRFDHEDLFGGLYEIAEGVVEREEPDHLVVAIDPVNFEKPYTKKLEGVSVVRKSTPPDLKGQARKTPGYPAITATIVNTRTPVVTYADWFSYTLDFKSENDQIYQAIQSTLQLFPQRTGRSGPTGQADPTDRKVRKVRFVGDSGLDDQKIFKWILQGDADFAIRARHLNRIVEVYSPKTFQWRTASLGEVAENVRIRGMFEVEFHHAGKTRPATVKLGWAKIRLPQTDFAMGALIVQTLFEDEDTNPLSEEEEDIRTIVLLVGKPIQGMNEAKEAYDDWRLRSRVEHVYRFDQEQGVDVEDVRVQTLERMRRQFALVLTAVTFIFSLIDTWPEEAVTWLRRLGGKLDRRSDRDGPYLVLRGLAALAQTVATLTRLLLHPFPHHAFSQSAFATNPDS